MRDLGDLVLYDNGFPHGPQLVLDERDSLCSNYVFIVENGCIQLTQGGTEIKYLLKERISRKRSFLSKSLGLAHLDTSLVWRTLYSVLCD